MRNVRLSLNPLDFDTLTELGRSVIPSAAPGWTDHNTHDPGVMLLELISWIAEAQMYGIARTRKDERMAFAGLVGLAPRGPVPATGVVWADPATPSIAWPAGLVVSRGTRVTPERTNAPAFFTTESIELTTAALDRVFTMFADGRPSSDWTSANARDGATFMPFGASPAAGDRLVLQFDGALTSGRTDTTISIGVHVVAPEAGSEIPSGADRGGRNRPTARLVATLRDDVGDRPLQIVGDTTRGLLQAGVLLLEVPGPVAGNRPAITLQSATGGFLRAPRLQQIAANALPIEQAERVGPEVVPFGDGRPDQAYALKRAGLMSPCDARPLAVTLHGDDGAVTWTRVTGFDGSGPADAHYVIDGFGAGGGPAVIRFGNGINGRAPARRGALEVEYWVSAGALGNQPANLAWSVAGIGGAFGFNPLPIRGGQDARGLPDLRRLARERVRTARPLVTSGDLVAAALAFTDLGVSRARELPSDSGSVPGTRVLVVAGPKMDTGSGTAAESREMLAEIRARLAPKLPLGQRLDVMAPRYVGVRVRTAVVAAPRVAPDDLRAEIVRMLQARFDLAPPDGRPGWPFGREVAATAIAGWIRKVEGVSRVAALTLESDGVPVAGGVVHLTDAGLPLLDVPNSTIAVERAPAGARR